MRRLLLVLGVVALTVGAAAVGASASSSPVQSAAVTETNESAPVITATLNGESVENDGFRVVRDHANLRFEVSLPDASGTTSLDTVLLRVDGETVYRNDDPGGSITVNRTLPIGGGNNTVRIVAEDTRDRVVSRSFRVYLETLPPVLELESPVATIGEPYRFPNVVAGETALTLSGRFTDFTGFEDAHVTIGRPGVRANYRTFSVRSPDGRFDRDVLFGYGRNNVDVTATDALGNRVFGSFTVRVVDRRDPELSLDYGDASGASRRLTVAGSASDNVWVRNVTVTVIHMNHTAFEPGQRDYVAVRDRRYHRSRARLNATFEQNVTLLDGRNVVTVTVSDHLGRRTQRSFTVLYQPDVQRPPTIDLVHGLPVVRDSGRVNVTALIADDDRDLARVEVETIEADSHEVVDFESIVPPENDSFLLERAVAVAPGANVVEIRAFDARGTSSSLRYFLNTSSGTVVTGRPATDEPTPDSGQVTTPGPTATPTPTVTRSTPAPTASTTTAPEPSGADVTPGPEPDTARPDAGYDSRRQSLVGDVLSTVGSPPVVAFIVVVIVGAGVLAYRRLTRV